MSFQDLIILSDKCEKLEAENAKLQKELNYFKALYNPLIEGAAKDTHKINELEKKLTKAVMIIKELQQMPEVCHLDDHFDFLKSIEN